MISSPLDPKLLDGYGDPNDVVTHDDVRYDLNKMRAGIRFAPRVLFNVDDLKWLLDECPWTDEDEARIPIVNMRRPIFVVMWEGKQCCVDGFHRIARAVREGKKYLPGIWVPNEVMERAKL
jgi:hypothetical protein